MIAYIKKTYTTADVLKSMEAPGKTRGRAAGGWVHDLCALKKVVTLCPFCTHKFNPGRLGYIKDKDLGPCVATCDGCKTFDTKCTAYYWEATFHEVRSTPAMRRAERTAARKRMGLPKET